MPASRTGTPSQVDGSAGDGSTGVTVPADATAVVAFWSHYDGNNVTSLSTLTLNGVGFTIQSQLAEGATADEVGVGVASLASPATGSQTVAWTWSAGGARAEGGDIFLVYVKDADVADLVRGASTNATATNDDLAINVTSETTDLVLAFAMSFTPTNPALSGTVFIDNTAAHSNIYDLSEVTAGAGSTAVTMTGEDFSSMAGIALKSAAGGGLTTEYVAPTVLQAGVAMIGRRYV